jgi:flavin-dependent dehydrogenase
MPKEITIIGGGLAGLTLGVDLRQHGVPVTLWEAGAYPRHRVCGEFISGKGISVLRRLGLCDSLLKAGARKAESVALCFGRRLHPYQLPEPALCLSRFHLDRLLAARLEALGARVKTETRYCGPWETDGLVRATGRDLQSAGKHWHWFGLKAHVRNVSLEADLEMHYGANAYVGLCRLDERTVNVCGLFRRQARDPKLGRDIPEKLRGAPGTLLFDRLREAEWDHDSICAVAGLSFGRLPSLEKLPCCVGDVFRMIPPLTGNGMSIAFESAELASAALVDYAQEKISWSEARTAIARGYVDAFRDRFFWADLLQRAAFSSIARPLSICFASQGLFQICFGKTR